MFVGPDGKMLFHIPNPHPKLAKHLTAKFPFLKPVGTSISPTNFEFQVENLNALLKVRCFDILHVVCFSAHSAARADHKWS